MVRRELAATDPTWAGVEIEFESASPTTCSDLSGEEFVPLVRTTAPTAVAGH